MVPPLEPNIFNTPPTPNSSGPLTQQQVQQFFSEGYVIVEEFFNPTSDIKPCLDDVEALVNRFIEDKKQRLLQDGKDLPSDDFASLDVFHRLTQWEKVSPGTSVALHKVDNMPTNFRSLFAHDKLLDAITQLMGPEVNAFPVWNLRPKLPTYEDFTVPWHQDGAYFDESAEKQLVITAWIPFLDTNEQNGTLQIVKNAHKYGRLAQHKGLWKDTWYIYTEEDDLVKAFGEFCNPLFE